MNRFLRVAAMFAVCGLLTSAAFAENADGAEKPAKEKAKKEHVDKEKPAKVQEEMTLTGLIVEQEVTVKKTGKQYKRYYLEQDGKKMPVRAKYTTKVGEEKKSFDVAEYAGKTVTLQATVDVIKNAAGEIKRMKIVKLQGISEVVEPEG